MSTTYVDEVMTRVFGENFEFWKPSTEITLRSVARDLQMEGWPVESTSALLSRLWSAVAEEYGD